MSNFTLERLRRMLTLRQFPLLAHADLDELATIAENLVEATATAGTVIATAGSRLRSIVLVLDGQIETQPQARIWGPRQVFGVLEVLANRDIAHTAIAATELRTLQLSARDLVEVVEDNFGVLLATLRELATRLAANPPAQRPLQLAPTGPLGLVERLILLRHQLPFTKARLQALATLAHASEEIMWPAQTTIVRAGERATSGFTLISGSAIATRGDEHLALQAGMSIGHLETLAGTHHTATIETTTPVRALRSRGSAIVDVLEDHTDVGLAMLTTFASALLDAPNAASARYAPLVAA
jgi:CRP-like cAMP-binding protein